MPKQATSMCVLVDSFRQGGLSKFGFVHQDDVDFNAQLIKRCGQCYPEQV